MATTVTVNSPSPPPLSPSQPSPSHFPHFPVPRTRKRRKSKSHLHCSRSPVRTSVTNYRRRGPIKLSEETPPPCASGAASNQQMQRKFMEMMGWVHEAIKIDDLVNIVSKELAKNWQT